MDQATIDLITGAVDWSLIIGGIGVVAVAMAGLYLAIRGGKILLGYLKSA